MSRLLWKLYLEDDVDNFVQLLERAGTSARPQAHKASIQSIKSGSPAVGSPQPGGHSLEYALEREKYKFQDIVLTRADVNRRDGRGMTLLHHAASSVNENAKAFALALLEHQYIDLYVQDLENGWTPLHRCFYFGNITIARAILERELQDKLSRGVGVANDVSLIKLKDHEGNGPFDLLTETIQDRTLHPPEVTVNGEDDEEDLTRSTHSEDLRGDAKGTTLGDGVLTFGSNKNITLGLGNEDDRQFPERIQLRRPEHLYRRFLREHYDLRASAVTDANPTYAESIRQSARALQEVLPTAIRHKSLLVEDVQLSKFHSAVLTNDPTSNLHICGHGTGGRLGTGNEKTQFNFVCIQDPAISRKKIVAIGLGQDHTLAATSEGELFSWGSNAFGQLGTGMSKTSGEEPMQLSPKQIFGALKREHIVGAAASRTHSVVHTTTALFTFGKNDGQLGIVDAHAGTLEIQSTPRRIAASRFSCCIQSVSAIERATICLLENHEVHVFANFGAVKLSFPLDGFSNYFLKDSIRSTRYDERPNTIVKVTGGGDTICALSSAGEIYALTVDQRLSPAGSGSTTNPNKIRAALSSPSRVWTLKKGHMNARDVGVDHDGSIILSTEAGSVWRRVKRTNLPGARKTEKKSKEFKFSRVPGITRAVAVRASASGAYCAIERDCDVTRTHMAHDNKSLWQDVGALLPFKNIIEIEENLANPVMTFWTRPKPLKKLVNCLASSADLEADIHQVLSTSPNEQCLGYDCVLTTTSSEVAIPAHSFILAARSPVVRAALAQWRRTGEFQNDILSITGSKPVFKFKLIDFLTLIELILFAYTDQVVAFWMRSKNAPEMAHRYRQVRVETMKIANRLEMRNLEAVARKMTTNPLESLNLDMELALFDAGFAQSGNVRIQLKDGEVTVHSDLISRRCPFFEGLLQGRTNGRWMASRQGELESTINFSHVEMSTFHYVLRHIYADTYDELFDDLTTPTLDEYLDTVLEVLSVANELMLDGLSKACQRVLGRHGKLLANMANLVTTRNACGLLNAVAPCTVNDFKDLTLEYICLNLEAMLTNQYLDELDEDILHELDKIVRDNQLSTLPIAKSGRQEALLLEKYPHLAARIDSDRQRKLDVLTMQIKYSSLQNDFGTSLHAEEDGFHAKEQQRRQRSGPLSPRIAALQESEPSSVEKSPSLPVTPRAPAGQAPVAESFELGPSAVTVKQGQPSKSWTPPPLTNKLGIKEIMAQTTATRPSGIALGLASQARTDSSPGFGARVSQKERRRLQQQLLDEEPPSPEPWQSSPKTNASPWQAVTRAKPAAGIFAVARSSPSEPKSNPRNPQTPQLTMRQTVANAPKDKQSPQPSKPSSSQPSPRPTPPRSASTTQPLEIKSIRHTPRPDAQISPSFYVHQSMADILSQQEAEKTVIREASAKRSLQEIQQEQEFLSWWDAERKRVADEEAALAAEQGWAEQGRRRSRGNASVGRRPRPSRGKEQQQT